MRHPGERCAEAERAHLRIRRLAERLGGHAAARDAAPIERLQVMQTARRTGASVGERLDDDVAALEEVSRTTALDPLIGGISCGNPRITAGTLGAIVFNRTTCKPMILSNWHVLAGASAAAVDHFGVE